MAEDMTPEEVMTLLRDFHRRMEEIVVRHNGCLEKFIGDALLAMFGVPEPGPRDAADTLASGDIGSRHSMAFATVRHEPH
jgi:adenylate cyclase